MKKSLKLDDPILPASPSEGTRLVPRSPSEKKTERVTFMPQLSSTSVRSAIDSVVSDYNRLSVLTKVLLAIAIAGEIAGLVLACIQIYLYPNVFFSYVALTLATFALIASLASLSEKVDEYNVLPGGLK